MSDSPNRQDGTRTRPQAKASTWRTALLASSAVVLYLFWTRPGAPPVGWGEDFAAALTEAKATNRPLLIEFHSEGCAPCVLMERQVLPDARVQEAVRGFVPVRVDAFRNLELMQRYEVPGTPAFVITDSSGKARTQILGARTVEDFLEFLRKGAATAPQAAAEPPETPAPPDSQPE